MAARSASQLQPSLFKSVKNLDGQGVVNYFNSLDIDWLELAMFGAIGVLSGFLFKRYFKMFLLCSLLGAGLISGLDYFGLIHINWDQVNTVLGTTPTQNVDSLFQTFVAWIKLNSVQVIVFTVGFLFGFKAF